MLETDFFFPREWEYTWVYYNTKNIDVLFPTRVGVYLANDGFPFEIKTFSHASGSIPRQKAVAAGRQVFFPREWEYTRNAKWLGKICDLFPTHVGVYPEFRVFYTIHKPFSHTRGSVPMLIDWNTYLLFFFPHTWECSIFMEDFPEPEALFLHTWKHPS